jgi:hypothetical protein
MASTHLNSIVHSKLTNKSPIKHLQTTYKTPQTKAKHNQKQQQNKKQNPKHKHQHNQTKQKKFPKPLLTDRKPTNKTTKTQLLNNKLSTTKLIAFKTSSALKKLTSRIRLKGEKSSPSTKP